MSSHPTTTQRVLESGAATQPTLVLLHGATTAAWMWRPQLPLLGERYHTFAPDLPGFGTAAASGPFSMDRAAQEVVALVPERTLAADIPQEVKQHHPELLADTTASAGQKSKRNVLSALSAMARVDF